jgi:SAM-dependent methyltransferase
MSVMDASSGTAWLPRHVRLLDVGAGPGKAELALAGLHAGEPAARSYEVTTVDPSRHFEEAMAGIEALLGDGGVHISRRLTLGVDELLRCAPEEFPQGDWVLVCNALSSFSRDHSSSVQRAADVVAAIVQRAAGVGRRVLLSVIETGCRKYLDPVDAMQRLLRGLVQRWRVTDVYSSTGFSLGTPHLPTCRLHLARICVTQTSVVCSNLSLEPR